MEMWVTYAFWPFAVSHSPEKLRDVRPRDQSSLMPINRSLLSYSLALVALLSTTAFAQGDAKRGEIRGRLVETGTTRPITGGSITVRHAGADSSFAAGALPKEDG